MLEAAIAGAIAGFAIAIPVGAIAVLIIHVAITGGLRPGLAVAVFVASISWQSLLAVFGSVVGRGSSHRVRLATAIVGNLIVLGFGLVIAWQVVAPR